MQGWGSRARLPSTLPKPARPVPEPCDQQGCALVVEGAEADGENSIQKASDRMVAAFPFPPYPIQEAFMVQLYQSKRQPTSVVADYLVCSQRYNKVGLAFLSRLPVPENRSHWSGCCVLLRVADWWL